MPKKVSRAGAKHNVKAYHHHQADERKAKRPS